MKMLINIIVQPNLLLLDKYATENMLPNSRHFTDDGISGTLAMPKSYVSYRKPRKVSEEQMEQAREKMSAINQAKNQ